ncbi:MAG: glycosyltransferase [Chloroflexota bacterium]|nr:MAG: glycosyltransferase [Chloroflexota bacterium]
MIVSVICPVLNEGASIEALIDSLLDQSRPPDEIVIVDGGSSDDTVARVQRYAAATRSMHLVIAPGTNIAAARNVAVGAARGTVIAATDAGCRVDRRWLEFLTDPFRGSDSVDVVGGAFRSDPRNAFEQSLGATTLPRPDEVRGDDFLPSSRSIAFRRECWEAVGGYPEWLEHSEDVVFDLALKRAGYRFAFEPRAIVHFRPRSTPRSFFRQYFLYARGDGKAGLWPARHAARYAAYAVGAIIVIAGLRAHRLWAAGAIAGALYVARPYARLLAEARQDGRPPSPIALALVPALRLIGDIAKMAGYPTGVAWRLSRRRARN